MLTGFLRHHIQDVVERRISDGLHLFVGAILNRMLNE